MLDEARHQYADRLDGKSKRTAMLDRSVIERIFQLKSLYPEKYAEAKGTGSTMIILVFDGKMFGEVKKRAEILEAETIPSTPEMKMEMPDNQADRVLGIPDKTKKDDPRRKG